MPARPSPPKAVRRGPVPVGLFALLFCPPAGGFAQSFTDVTEVAGIRFVHDAGEEGGYSLPEITGAGAGFFDADGDGDLDIYILQGGRPTDPDDVAPDAPGNALYIQGPPGEFTDRSEASGVAHAGYGMGLAVGDVDGDGLQDLFVTNYGPDVLFRNLGGGVFEDATDIAGVAGEGWSSSATFCDYDQDGRLDLYVARYVRNDPNKHCTRSDGSQDYCSPQVFPGVSDLLYRNIGDGAFEDVSLEAGLRAVRAPGLGVVCDDFDGDGRLDFYVANDGEANQLWLNAGDGTFTEDAFLAGVALNDAGRPEAGMGIALGDVDADADYDLFITHVADETNTLYRNDASEFGPAYSDRTTAAGLGLPSMALTGFGTGFLDVNSDGALDLVVANGRVQRKPPVPGASGDGFWSVYAEPNQVFINEGGDGGTARFVEAGEAGEAGDFGTRVEIGRGMAFADYDEDGDLDVLLANAEGPARLYRNDFPRSGAAFRVRPVAADGSAAFPTRVTVTLGDGREIVRRASPDGSYLAASDARAFFAVPEGETSVPISVRWPDGTRERFPDMEVADGAEVVLRRGDGQGS